MRLNDDLIPSGSLLPGIDPRAFGLPEHTALRYERPADPLRRCLGSYVVMDSMEAETTGCEWMLPGWAMIWVVLTPEPIRVEIGNRRYSRLGTSVLYGVTSRAMPVAAAGGVTVAIDVSPLGWARLFDRSAEALRDRIVPLAELLPTEFVEELHLALLTSDRSLGVKAVLDRLFLPRLATPHRDEAEILKLLALLEDERVTDFGSAALAHGLNPRSAARIARSYFGFPPKTLMMRTRFLRALLPLLDPDDRRPAESPIAGYYDRSHFNKDALRYLGMSPQRFIDIPSPYAAAARRLRQAVIGSPIAALDRLAEGDGRSTA